MGLFSGLGGSRTFDQGSYFGPGRFVVRRDLGKTIKSTDPKKKGATLAIDNFTVLVLEQSATDRAWINKYGNGKSIVSSIGSTHDTICDLSDTQVGVPKLKSFLRALFPEFKDDLDDEKKADVLATRAYGDEQFGSNRELYLVVTPTVSSKGNAVTNLRWRLMTAELRTQLGEEAVAAAAAAKAAAAATEG